MGDRNSEAGPHRILSNFYRKSSQSRELEAYRSGLTGIWSFCCIQVWVRLVQNLLSHSYQVCLKPIWFNICTSIFIITPLYFSFPWHKIGRILFYFVSLNNPSLGIAFKNTDSISSRLAKFTGCLPPSKSGKWLRFGNSSMGGNS